jgi:integrase
MGLYIRGRKMWWMVYSVDGKQHHESCRTHNKRLAKKILSIRLAEISEARWNLPASNPPRLKKWADQFLLSIQTPSTRDRYESSIAHLLDFFGDNTRLSDISVGRIEEFKQERLTRVRCATVNRDLSVFRRMLTLASRQRLIARNPFESVELLEERKTRRQPHILTFEEERKLLAVATPHLRALIVLIVNTGLRVNKEALQLKWEDFDFENSQVVVRESKTLAGRRIIPLTEHCKTEMLRWRHLVGPEYSRFAFPNLKTPSRPLGCIRKTWSTALRRAVLQPFAIYNLRATFASRLSAAGVPDVFVSQLLGHAGSLLQTYAKAIDDYRRDAIRKLEEFSHSRILPSPTLTNESAVQ